MVCQEAVARLTESVYKYFDGVGIYYNVYARMDVDNVLNPTENLRIGRFEVVRQDIPKFTFQGWQKRGHVAQIGIL